MTTTETAERTRREDIIDRLVNRPRRTGVFKVAFDPVEGDRLNDVRDNVHRARVAAEVSDDPAAHLALGEAEQAYEQELAAIQTIDVHMVALGGERYNALVDKHPATAAQQKAYRSRSGGDAQLRFNPDTFPKALVAEMIVKVGLDGTPGLTDVTADDLDSIWESWSAADQGALFVFAEGLCVKGTGISDLG